MNVNELLKIMQDNGAAGWYDVAIPSLSENFKFKSVTVGQKKTLSKSTVDSTTVAEAHAIRTALIKDLILDKNVNVDKLNIVDFVAILCQINMNNSLEYPELKFKCKKCDTDNIFRVDYDRILKACLELKLEIVEKEYTFRKIKYKFVMKDPSIIDMLILLSLKDEIYKEYEKLDESYESRISKYSADIILYYTIACMSEMYINGEKVDNLDFKAKIDIVKNLPSDIIYNRTKGLIVETVTKMPMDRYDVLFYPISCFKCDDKKEGMLNLENFFII